MTLAEGTVHLRAVWLDVGPDEVARSMSLLDADERARAERYVFPRHARRFAVCRATLRTTLASYLGVRADELRFEYSRHGKPGLAGMGTPCGLSFNVSHSDDLAVIAVAAGRELGVDIERRRVMEDCLRLADHVFSPIERRRLATISVDRSDAFLACWTRKEAYLKACGQGLYRALTEVTVSFGPGEPTRIVQVEGDPAEPSRWWLTEIEPAPGFVGSLAVRGEPTSLVWWRP